MSNLIESPPQELAADNEIRLSAPPTPTQLPNEPVRWRLIRLLVALPLLVVSLAALFPLSVVPVSTQAVVNARLSEVKAPIEGQVGEVRLETGDSVVTNQVLATTTVAPSMLHAEAVGDTRRRSDLKEESAKLNASLIAAQLEKARYDKMYNDYMQHTGADLTLQVREAQTAYDTAQKRAQSAADDLERNRQALKEHLISRPMLDQATEKADAAQSEADTRGANLRRLKQQASDVKAGFVLDPSKTPAFLSARDNAAAQVDRLREEKAALDDQLLGSDGLPTPVTGANGEPVKGARTTIYSPVSGTIWSRTVATGQAVQEGDDLFRIADANSIHVEVWLDRRYGPQLAIGDIALVYLNGMGKELRGRVTSFEGTSRRRLDEEVNAIDLQAVHPDQYHVSIELDPVDRRAEYIGQSAKVLFPGSKHPLRASIYFWITRM
ncbi:Multidrug resistance efflux pump [Granulicella rosea]|uniref:Multidrug resistance efflux pump n=1 Tax=Granulicella rosea TaxID=474952 RepID=A0A239MKD8_9BACT|nr:HlyD family efflux transporter periplasmic adaptor subunit [Granulicella rosea]SNT42614.1 Multidrug resistance efflux pump [Granulicella rosea]